MLCLMQMRRLLSALDSSSVWRFVFELVCCRMQLIKAEREDQLFPDEVDTPLHTSAKDRFQK